MIDPDVRRAGPDDAGQLRGSRRRPGRCWPTSGADPDGWTLIRARNTWRDVIETQDVLVAHIGAVVVGYLVLGIRHPLAKVDEVYVTPQARQLGFGDALLDAGVVIARDEGCSLLEGESLPGDRDTKNLYERAGIKARLITVSTEI